jgi:hypothetical protein
MGLSFLALAICSHLISVLMPSFSQSMNGVNASMMCYELDLIVYLKCDGYLVLTSCNLWASHFCTSAIHQPVYEWYECFAELFSAYSGRCLHDVIIFELFC